MIGKTNSSQGVSGIPSEYVNIRMITNQASHGDLVGTKFVLSYEKFSQEYVWSGSEMTLQVPAYVVCTIEWGDAEGYKKPEAVAFTTVEDNARTIEAEYKCELLTVNVSSDNGAVIGYEISISKIASIIHAVTGDAYIPLEYIESTSTQYIDTGFKPNQDTRIVIKSKCPITSSNNWLFGARTSTSSNKFAFLGHNKGYYQSQFGEVSKVLETPYNKDGVFVLEQDKNKIYVDGVLAATHTETTFQAPVNLFLFAVNTNGEITYSSSNIQLYSCQIYDNGTLIRDYVPVKNSEGVAGLYDKVNNEFYPSASSDNFLAGGIVKETIAIQTSHTGVYKIPFDTLYNVEANNIDGFKTPQSVSRVASEDAYITNMQYSEYTGIDLSKFDIYGNVIEQTTANCYVVSKADTYKIPLVFGNALKNGTTNSAAYTNHGGSNSHDFVDYNGAAISSPYIESVSGAASSAQLSIADTDGVFTDISIIDGSPCRYLQFKVASVPTTGANGVLSIKNSDGIIMWSWHIWVWADDLSVVEITNTTSVKYKILPVNLASKWDDTAKTKIKNWFYQFGRPNPMLCPSAYNSTSHHASFGSLGFTITSTASHLYNGIQSPTTFFKHNSSHHNWFNTNSGRNYNLWDADCNNTGNSDNNVVKTIYDPSPIGFKMPNGNTFTGISVIDTSNGIVKLTRYSGDSTGVGFPLSGNRRSSDGSLYDAGSFGYVWLSSAKAKNSAYCLNFTPTNVSPQGSMARANGFSVRPVQEKD